MTIVDNRAVCCDGCGRIESLIRDPETGLRITPLQWRTVVLHDLNYVGCFHACSIFCEDQVRSERSPAPD